MSDSLDANQSAETENKQRRLVPQFSLNNRHEPKQIHHEAPKKSVTRYTREQLIALRRPSSILPSMKVMSEVSSLETQEPVCFTKLEPEDVVRIWNAATKDMAGRGRGRARGSLNRSEDHPDDLGHDSTGDLWDDGAAILEGKEFDLSEISKASLQFRNDMENLKLSSEIEISQKEEDTVEKLLEQQNARESKARDESNAANAAKVAEEKITSATAFTQSSNAAPLSSLAGSQLNSSIPPPATKLDIELPFEKPRPTPDAANTGFLKNVIGESVFLPSISSSAPLINPTFGVNTFFQPEPLLYAPPAPQPPPLDPEWFYTDPQKQVQGPFTQDNMRLWNEAGYFGKDLPIKLRHWNDFHLFKDVFPDPRIAFYTIPQEPIRMQSNLGFLLPLNSANSGLLGENVRRSNPMESLALNDNSSIVLGNDVLLRNASISNEKSGRHIETSRIVDNSASLSSGNINSASVLPPKPDPVPDRREPPKNVQEQSISNTPQKLSVEKSDYAKQILGINRKNENVVDSKSAIVESSSPPAATVVSKTQEPELSIAERSSKDKALENKNKGWKTDSSSSKPVSFLDIQQEAVEEQKVLKEKTVVVPTPNSNQQPTAAMSVQLKSLLGLKPNSNAQATAAVVTKPKTAWSSASAEVPSVPLKEIMKEEINQQQQKKEVNAGSDRVGGGGRGVSWASKIGSNQPVPAGPQPIVNSSTIVTKVSQPPPAPFSEKSTPNVSNSRPVSKGPETKSDFGGKKMSKEVAEWCASQLKAIKGIEDLTLMEFCMSLNSAAEIRETLASYLGSSPQVTNFATEFIKYKEEGKLPSKAVSVIPEPQNSANSGLIKKKKNGK